MKPIFEALDKYESKKIDFMEISNGTLRSTEYFIDGTAKIILDLIPVVNNLIKRVEKLEKENADKE